MKISRKSFFDCFRAFHKSVRGKTLTSSQVAGLSFLLDKIEADTLSIQEASYLLATISHETAWTFQAIMERGPRSYFDKYEGRKTLGNTQKGDGYKYRGAGFTQITGRRNFTLFANLLGADLVNNPSFALDPEIAYRIVSIGMKNGLFTGKSLSDYITKTKTDYKNARRIINGTDKAALIAGYAKSIEGCLTGSLEDPPAQPEPQEQPVGPTVNVEQAQNVTAPPPPVKGGSVGDVPQEVAQTKPSWITRIIGVATGIATPLGAAGIKLGGFQISSAAVIAMCAFGIVGLMVGAWIYNEGQKRAARLTELQLLNRAKPSEINVSLKQE